MATSQRNGVFLGHDKTKEKDFELLKLGKGKVHGEPNGKEGSRIVCSD